VVRADYKEWSTMAVKKSVSSDWRDVLPVWGKTKNSPLLQFDLKVLGRGPKESGWGKNWNLQEKSE